MNTSNAAPVKWSQVAIIKSHTKPRVSSVRCAECADECGSKLARAAAGMGSARYHTRDTNAAKTHGGRALAGASTTTSHVAASALSNIEFNESAWLYCSGTNGCDRIARAS